MVLLLASGKIGVSLFKSRDHGFREGKNGEELLEKRQEMAWTRRKRSIWEEKQDQYLQNALKSAARVTSLSHN